MHLEVFDFVLQLDRFGIIVTQGVKIVEVLLVDIPGDVHAVEHRTFGRGEILKATPCGNDCILEIQFESIGFKRLMAAFAKVKKIN